ncbi:MAG: response regulator [Cyclobacteriaceae bacterium]
MSKKINCIMLIDDNEDDNFIHERAIKKNDSANIVIAMQSGREALDYLKGKESHPESHPDLIFLDINMPEMSGWDFLKLYNTLDAELQSKVVVVMLTTSDNPDDQTKSGEFDALSDYKTKPLTAQMLDEVIDAHF